MCYSTEMLCPGQCFLTINVPVVFMARYVMILSQQPFFRAFKKSTAPYKVHNMGLRYINNVILPRPLMISRHAISCGLGSRCYSPNGGGQPGVRRSRRRTGKRRCFLPDPGAEFSGRTATAAAGNVSGPDISARKT
jgi:hypothetical protein